MVECGALTTIYNPHLSNRDIVAPFLAEIYVLMSFNIVPSAIGQNDK